MSDKTEVPDKSKTPDKLEKFLAGGDIILNCLISDEGVNDIFEVTISNANDNRPQRIYSGEKGINVIVYPPTETVPEVLSRDD
ncbi:hypothetical protein RhiirA4_453704 [Rhizophagus irregularis]|uniref:Uncharacterized protein n=1 Tax=Rhizophagus irregularis TaxID=588596 RepID=A0A2I1G189_9GLOM|nr:hypothetical protein RhiirA4_453704 [Rhizophagus irregularis]